MDATYGDPVTMLEVTVGGQTLVMCTLTAFGPKEAACRTAQVLGTLAEQGRSVLEHRSCFDETFNQVVFTAHCPFRERVYLGKECCCG